MIVPATALTIVALVVLSAATGLGGVVAAAVLYGIGFGSAQPALQAAMLSMVPRERFGIANASFFTAFDLGIAFGIDAAGLGVAVAWATGRSLRPEPFSVAISSGGLRRIRPTPCCGGEEEVVAS